MHGIGDSIYQLPFITELSQYHEVYLDTPLHWMYQHLGSHVKFVKPDWTYRTQKKSLESGPKPKYVKLPKSYDTINPFYTGEEYQNSTLIHIMEDKFGVKYRHNFMELPQFDVPVPVKAKGKIAVVRPPTVRDEWRCETRNCDPQYTNWCAYMLKRAGYTVVSIADTAPNEEWIVGPEPVADYKFHNGELSIQQVIELIRMADVVVGGAGFIVPMAVATRTNIFTIFGGRGGYDSPSKIFDMRMLNKGIGWAIPHNFCKCTRMRHTCNKTIRDFDTKFFEYMRGLDE
jgi:hypothetical protein